MNPSLWLVAVQRVGCRVIGAWLVIYMRLSSALCVYPLFICELAWSGMEWTGLGLFFDTWHIHAWHGEPGNDRQLGLEMDG